MMKDTTDSKDKAKLADGLIKRWRVASNGSLATQKWLFGLIDGWTII
jgi:hypothetical protein